MNVLKTQNKTADTAYNVYVTKDYDKFKRLRGNRDIPESRISKIVESIQTVGWIRNPIVVNENMEVIDGQGRLTALQRLGKPIEYIIAEGAGSEECIYMNMNMVNWSQLDFIKSYAEQGNENYQKLLNLINTYAGGNLHIICTALYRISKPKHREIKNGSLQITDQQFIEAVARLKYIQPLMEKLDKSKLPGSIVMLMQTLIYYHDYIEVDKDRLRKKVEKYIYETSPWVTNPDCEREVEDVYNRYASFDEKQSIQHLIKEERMRQQAQLYKESQKRALERTQKGVRGFIKKSK